MLSFMFDQITVVESVAEGTADSGPTVSTESTAKPPPFKDPAFMVTGCADGVCGVFLSPGLLQMWCLYSSPSLSIAFWDRWSRSW